MKSLREAQAFYEGLPEAGRATLQRAFGKEDLPNREEEFYKWLAGIVDVGDLMRGCNIRLTDVIDLVIAQNGIIGVGLVTLAKDLSDHVKSRI